MKNYTDIEQSKKLAEILPIESADMHYNNGSCRGVDYTKHFSAELMPYQEALHLIKIHKTNFMFQVIPCWSLAALLDVIKPINENTYTIRGTLDGGATISFDEITNVMFQEEEIIDAVFEMVCWLKENEKI